ncbi:MAG: HlyD family type I secretion periplasmic adaptor subunit [Rhodocyclaceae bacterium]|nr:HlyD family type I secretion periplasmic adaptor subunit [Rhodocyclaceae bacterium]
MPDKPSRSLDGLVVGEDAADREFREWTRFGMLVLLLSFGVAIAWSSAAPLASAVVAPAVVKVDSNRKKIQHQEGGVIKQILVRDGDRVRAGDVLVRLDETRASASAGVIQSQYDAALALRSRLEAERDKTAAIDWPDEWRGRSTEPALEALRKAQQTQFAARRASIVGQLAILDQQIASKRSEIRGLEGQRTARTAQLNSLRTELDGLTGLLGKGMVERTKYRNLEREIARVGGELGEHVSDIAAARSLIGEKELEKFQLRKAFHEEVADELRRVQTEIFDYRQRIDAARYVLAQTELRAPTDGIVTGLQAHTEGGVVGPGEVLMQIVPDDHLILEAKVSPQDVDRIRVGLQAGIKLSAFDQRTLPELNGRVTYLSADTIEDQRTGTNHFLTRIEVPDTELARLDGHRIQPGMIANVFVRTGERTFIDYLLHPVVASFDKAWRER